SMRYSPGDGRYYSRSGWGTADFWGTFVTGTVRQASHETLNTGHVEIVRGSDQLIINAQEWTGAGADGVMGNPSNADPSNSYASTLYVDDGRAYTYGCPQYCG